MICETSDPNRRAADRDRLRILLEEIEKLPEKQAAVLKMRTLEGLEYDEISRRTGLSQVNIRVLISMARKTLKKKTGI
jgi:RNA polymerase sigma-70 factor (ECF subfamily)